MQTPGDRLLWARRTAGLTTRELATAADVAFGLPTAIEKGHISNPRIETIDKLCRVLGCEFDWLWRGSGRPPSESRLKAAGKRAKEAA